MRRSRRGHSGGPAKIRERASALLLAAGPTRAPPPTRAPASAHVRWAAPCTPVPTTASTSASLAGQQARGQPRRGSGAQLRCRVAVHQRRRRAGGRRRTRRSRPGGQGHGRGRARRAWPSQGAVAAVRVRPISSTDTVARGPRRPRAAASTPGPRSAPRTRQPARRPARRGRAPPRRRRGLRTRSLRARRPRCRAAGSPRGTDRRGRAELVMPVIHARPVMAGTIASRSPPCVRPSGRRSAWRSRSR